MLVDEFETAAVEVAHEDSGDVERVVLINLSGRVNKSTDRPSQMFSLLPEDALALIDGIMIALETIDKARK